MPVKRLFLRVLLCLVIVVNGMTASFAAVGTSGMQGHSDLLVMQGGCTAYPKHEMAAGTEHQAPKRVKHEECCESTACAWLCSSQAQVAATHFDMSARTEQCVNFGAEPPAEYRPPDEIHLMRPPIG